ncbi:hypothetical protein QR680_013841 [Steinernema hermaphroditum]|uniref:Uncharacterized protein n=1 Tax=Steinernema hermaphroditum TaxID=289476 RepID=A0AA39I956_9BILA|nr:hypothetical protein QR680_013841 [Steinernema hermaphroditum]
MSRRRRVQHTYKVIEMPTARQFCFFFLVSLGILCGICGFVISIVIYQTTKTTRRHDWMPLACGIGFAVAGALACAVGLGIYCCSQDGSGKRQQSVYPVIVHPHPKFPTYRV